MAETSGFKLKIPPAITKYLAPDTPKDLKMMAAKGMVPMPPPILASVLTFFLNDTDAEIQGAAKESLAHMPNGMVTKLVQDELHPKALDYFAKERADQETLIEGIILNKLTLDETFVFLAERVAENLATTIGNNQVRLMRTPAIATALRKNPKALKSEVDRIVSFLRINGIVVEGESIELTSQEIKEIMTAEEPTGVQNIPKELIEEPEDKNVPIEEEKKKSLYQLIQTMSVAQKVKLALKGNKEARSLLIKDSNKIVSGSVIKSPRITEGEVIAIAQLRSVSDDIIRLISNNPEWTKNYNLQVALCNNPKTPFPIGLKIIKTLRVPDLEKMSRNKNVANQLARLAKTLWEQKRG